MLRCMKIPYDYGRKLSTSSLLRFALRCASSLAMRELLRNLWNIKQFTNFNKTLQSIRFFSSKLRIKLKFSKRKLYFWFA